MIMHVAHDVTAIDLNLLVALKTLLGERHVTRAARQLGLSQSATSHALARLRVWMRELVVRAARAALAKPNTSPW